MTPEILISVENLSRVYYRGQHEIKAVDNVSTKLHKGEFLSVVGASGSGKSTLLNLLAGLDTPTSGIIHYAGQNLTDFGRKELSAYRAAWVGMVFQSFNLLSYQTALKNVELALYFNNTPRKDRNERAAAILEKLGLGDRMDHRPVDLSGGEQQRVAIARALVKNPEILFADEPTGNLDQANTDSIADLITELNRGGLTIIMVTHDRELAARCAKRIVRMHYGKIVDDSSQLSRGTDEAV